VTCTTLSLAGATFTFSAPSDDALYLPSTYSPFVSTLLPEIPDALFDVMGTPDAIVAPEYTTLAWEEPGIRLRCHADSRWLIDLMDVLSRSWRTVADVSGDMASGTLRSRQHPSLAGRLPVFHAPYDRVLISGRLAHLGGAVLHACSVADSGKALLFAGASGTGKTTMARLWHHAGATLMNDERTIVLTRNGKPVAGSTPWHGEDNRVSPLTAPPGAILFIGHSDRNRLTPLSPPEIVARLMTLSIIPLFLKDAIPRLLNLWSDVAEQIPCYDFGFIPDPSAVALVRETLSRPPSP
jgi:hypothetical protein